MPILGGFGNASEYAYRSFISEIPNQYNWIDLYNVEPGVEHRAGYAKITGIKSPLPIRVSAGTSFSLISNVFDNGQTVTFDNNYPIIASFDEYSNPNNRFQPGLGDNITCAFINSGVSINLSITPPKNLKTDFSKTYTTLVSVGKTSQDWIVSTRPIDETPTLFSFSGITTTTNTFVESNQMKLSGLEPGFSFTSEITSGIGTISVNNVDRGSSYVVSNGDTIKLKTKSSNLFNTKTNVVLKVGTYSTTWNVTTEQENLNITFTPTDFTDQSSVGLSTYHTSDQITLSGLSLNSDLPVTLSNTNATYEIERGASVIKSFDASPIEVVNNDKIRLRLTSSSSYSTAVSTNMTIGNKTVDWNVTTRSAPPPPVDPPPRVDPPPTKTTYDIQTVYRYYNKTTGRHFCAVSANVSGFANEGELFTTFINQAPGTSGVLFTFNGQGFKCGYAYFNFNVVGGTLYSLVNSTIGDELWSTSNTEGTTSGYVFNRKLFVYPRSTITV